MFAEHWVPGPGKTMGKTYAITFLDWPWYTHTVFNSIDINVSDLSILSLASYLYFLMIVDFCGTVQCCTYVQTLHNSN